MNSHSRDEKTHEREKVGCGVTLSVALSLLIFFGGLLYLSNSMRNWEQIPSTVKLLSSSWAIGATLLLGSGIAYVVSPRKTLGIAHALCMGVMALVLFVPACSFAVAKPGVGGLGGSIAYAVACAMMFIGVVGAICAVLVLRACSREKPAE